MRIKELDTSHRCLLQHLETFRKMTTSYEEIRGYVNGVLQEMARDLNQQSSLLKFDEKFDEKTIPKGYLEASDIQAWKGTNDALVSIGLEGFDQGLGAIVGSSAVDQCRAFVYSRYYWSINNDTAIDQLRRKLRSPQGFVAAKQRGYLFTKELDELSIEDFCNPQALTKYFREPLNLLIDWLTKDREAIRRTAELTRK